MQHDREYRLIIDGAWAEYQEIRRLALIERASFLAPARAAYERAVAAADAALALVDDPAWHDWARVRDAAETAYEARVAKSRAAVGAA